MKLLLGRKRLDARFICHDMAEIQMILPQRHFDQNELGREVVMSVPFMEQTVMLRGTVRGIENRSRGRQWILFSATEEPQFSLAWC